MSYRIKLELLGILIVLSALVSNIMSNFILLDSGYHEVNLLDVVGLVGIALIFSIAFSAVWDIGSAVYHYITRKV